MTARGNARRARRCPPVPHFLIGDWAAAISGFSMSSSRTRHISPARHSPIYRARSPILDPRCALDGGPDGLGCYRSACGRPPRLMGPGASLPVRSGWARARPLRQSCGRTDCRSERCGARSRGHRALRRSPGGRVYGRKLLEWAAFPSRVAALEGLSSVCRAGEPGPQRFEKDHGALPPDIGPRGVPPATRQVS